VRRGRGRGATLGGALATSSLAGRPRGE